MPVDDPNRNFTNDSTDNPDAQLAGTGGLADDITSPETGGDPTVSDMTVGGTGTSVGSGEDVGGAGGSGGGMVDRIGGIGTTGGTSSGTLGGSVGSPMPPRPEDPDGDENTI